jgi:hypothetical protein
MEYQQNSLFSSRSYRVSHRWEPYLGMSLTTICAWQDRIKTFQQAVLTARQHQAHLFSPVEDKWVNPFSLAVFSEDFYRLPKAEGDACIYFVIDFAVPLLLYVGETSHSNRRWRGNHDCKHYLNQYRSVLQSHRQPINIGITFDWNAPLPKQARLQLELSLIKTWRSPFNKENWHYWNTPFV